jgi:ParB/RepB/Spo0J family partition protein
MSKLLELPIDQIREGAGNLRTVDTKSDKFLHLVDNVAKHGVINAISVTPYTERDEDDPEKIVFEGYRVVDGLHRWTAACEAGLETVPCHVIDVSDEDDLAIKQISGNLQVIATKPAEFAAKIRELMSRRPMTTIAELAAELDYSEKFINDRLQLNKLDEAIKPLVDEGEIKLQQAYRLAQLPEGEQSDWVEEARTASWEDFAARVDSRLKEIRQERMANRASEVAFEPKPHLRKISEIQAERESLKAVKSLLSANNVTDPSAAAMLVLDWILHLDPEAVAEGQAKWEAAKKKREEAREAKSAEQIAKKKEKYLAELKKLEEEEAALTDGEG